MHTCNNCYHQFEGKFCNNCGQKATVGRLHLHDLWHEAMHAFTHADKGIIKLIKDLSTVPGKAYRAYFSGRRASYFNPVLFFLLTAGISIYLGDRVFDYEDKVNGMNNEFGRFVLDHVKLLNLFLLPIEALLTWLFFFRRNSFVECLVFWLYCNGIVFVFRVAVTPIYLIFIRNKTSIDHFVSLAGSMIMLWHLLSLFGGKPKLISFLKCLLLINIVMLCYEYGSGYFIVDEDIFTYPVWQMIRKMYLGW